MIQLLVKSLDNLIERSDQTLPEAYFYSSLSFCITDAIFSMNVRYEGVENTVKALSSALNTPAFKNKAVEEYSIRKFYAVLDGVHETEIASRIFKNRQRTSSRSGITKALAVKEACAILMFHEVNLFQDFTKEKMKAIEADFLKIKGQGSGISYKYFCMLAGDENTIKPDRMVCRYISEAMELKNEVDPATAEVCFYQAYQEVSKKYPSLTPRFLDHLIWRYQRGRQPRKKQAIKLNFVTPSLA